jgi:hypothetical protein
MLWKFEILNRDNIATVIEEPVGWENNASEIKRDPDYHGVFFSNQGETFEFYNDAMRIIKDEYDQYGFEGNMTLIMSENCGTGYEEFSRGRFDFNKYEYYCGDSCYVKIPVEKTGEIVELRNRLNQKVNLEALKAFDGITDLPAYSKLPFEMDFPSKGIKVQNNAAWQTAQTTTVSLSEVPKIERFAPDHYNRAWFQIVPQFENITLSEFGRFTTAAIPEHQYIKSGFYPVNVDPALECVVNGTAATAPDTQRVYFDWSLASPLLVNEANASNFDAIKTFSCSLNYSFTMSLTFGHVIALYNILVIRRKGGTFEYLDKQRIFAPTFGGGPGGYNSGSIWLSGTTHTVSFSTTRTGIKLNDGDYLFTAVVGFSLYATSQAVSGLEAYKITSVSGSVEMTALSYVTPTASKVFAINETISRIAESITNNKLKAYSEYFGRTDSEPYALPADGCGSLEIVTDGIRLRRQENKIPGNTSIFSLSIQDIFEGISPIHNIGMGLEIDTNRIGFNRLRIEPWKYFYNDSVIMSCTGIKQLSRKSNDKEVYSTFQFGYGKWEAEEYNGLDEFLTKRIGRTTLSQVKNDLIKLSKWIGSGYAIEVTRRKGNDNTKDWRYDKETFIICCKRGATSFSAQCSFHAALHTLSYDGTLNPVFFKVGHVYSVSGTALNNVTFTVSGIVNPNTTFTEIIADRIFSSEFVMATFTDITADLLSVETGNIISPVNIIDPDTLYNYRISPVRNAMRWMNRIFESYRQFGIDCKLIFTDGDGNYFASGEMESANCKIESGVLIENQTIDVAAFNDPEDCKPFLIPERIVFDYPMSSREYKLLEANPYGQIYFESDCEEGYGYIDTVNYKMEEGMATFNLIPKAL